MNNKIETFSSWIEKKSPLHKDFLIKQYTDLEKSVKASFSEDTKIFVCDTYKLKTIYFPIYKIIWNSITIIISLRRVSIDSPINIYIPYNIIDFEEENDNLYSKYCEENKKKFTFNINCNTIYNLVVFLKSIFGFIVNSYFIAIESEKHKIAAESNSKCEYYQKIIDKDIKEYQEYLISLAEKLCKNKNKCFLNIKDKFYVVNGEERYFLNKYSEINIRYRINSCDICTKEPNLTISVIDESRPLGSYERYKTFYLSDYKDLKDIGIILEEYCKKLY